MQVAGHGRAAGAADRAHQQHHHQGDGRQPLCQPRGGQVVGVQGAQVGRGHTLSAGAVRVVPGVQVPRQGSPQVGGGGQGEERSLRRQASVAARGGLRGLPLHRPQQHPEAARAHLRIRSEGLELCKLVMISYYFLV